MKIKDRFRVYPVMLSTLKTQSFNQKPMLLLERWAAKLSSMVDENGDV